MTKIREYSVVFACIALISLAGLLSGCAFPPRPAKTEVTPGESEIRSERDERRPSETVLRIRASRPEVEPQVVVRILPPQSQEEK